MTSNHTKLHLGLLLLRLGFGGMLIVFHGLGKILHFSTLQNTFPDPIGIGSLPSLLASLVAEVLGGSLVIIGYKTRLALVPMVFTMLVVAIIVHQNDPWITSELAYLYAIAFAVLFVTGPGKWSVDELLK